jgi:hypothetical protein
MILMVDWGINISIVIFNDNVLFFDIKKFTVSTLNIIRIFLHNNIL